MISNPFQFLMYNVALLMLLVFMVELVTAQWRPRTTTFSRIPVGVTVGIIGVIVMQTHWKLADGAIFDTRSIILSISGLFFGTVPTLIAMVITATFRYLQGGIGVMPGILVIVFTGSVGLLWRHTRSKELKEYTFMDFFVMGVVVHIVMLLMMLTFPQPLASEVIGTIAFPVMALYPAGTALISMLMVRQLQKDDLLQTIRTEETKLRIITEHTSDWDYWIGADHRFRYCSPSVERITGYPPSRFFDQPDLLHTIVHPEDAALFHQHQHHADAHLSEEIDFRIIRNDDAVRWIAHSCTPVYDAAGTFLGTRGSNRDITDKKRTEQQLERATHELTALLETANRSRTALLSVVEDQKLAQDALEQLNNELEDRVKARTIELERAYNELEAYNYSVSHDLRAPLRGINGFTRILQEDHSAHLPAEARELLADIIHSATNMNLLIDDLLELSRLSRKELKQDTVNIRAMFQAVFDEVMRGNGSVPVSFTLHDLPDAPGDYSLLKQVAMNLLSNAVKFSAKKDHPCITVSGSVVDGMAEYVVADNGDGFDPQFADKLFGVFQRLHRTEEFEGTGVGLAIVKRIVERHGGTVRAEGIPQQGATFRFTLPVTTMP